MDKHYLDIAIDIGNSGIKIAKKTRPLEIERFALPFSKEVLEQIKFYVKEMNIHKTIISSVNPDVSKPVKDFFSTISDEVKTVSIEDQEDFNVNFDLYDKMLLGIDRAICAEAAVKKYNSPVIIIDTGTATTIDVVDKENNFLGGMILPGLLIGLNALQVKTAQLPLLQLQSDTPLIGQNTLECMLSGAIHGNALLFDSVIKKIWETINDKGKTVITGGNAKWLFPLVQEEVLFEPNLIFEGLFYILDKGGDDDLK